MPSSTVCAVSVLRTMAFVDYTLKSWVCFLGVLSVCLSVCLQSVFESKGFSEVSADTLSYLLQSDRLTMEEEDILDKVKEWANISSVSHLQGGM